MTLYRVEAIITLKRGIRDPEAETIYRYLILDKGFSEVKSVRVGKQILFAVEAESREKALETVKVVCEKLRLYNPVIHDLEVRLIG